MTPPAPFSRCYRLLPIKAASEMMVSEVATQLERQCEIVAACEALDTATTRLAWLSSTPHVLDLWRLPMIMHACAAGAAAEATALREWAAEAQDKDALLARDLNRIASKLAELDEDIMRATNRAQAFATSESFDDLAHSKGDSGPQGPPGPAGRDAKVTCTVKKTKNAKKVTVTCKVVLAHAAKKSAVRWRLLSRGRTIAHGVAYAHRRRLQLTLSDLGRLRPGRYVLRIAGRRNTTTILVR